MLLFHWNSKPNYSMQLLLVLCGLIKLISTGGVYPNYHAHFDFIKWDKSKTAKDLDNEKLWWQTASFYQIYPRSFKDSNADGIGDLQGIKDQLPYLKEIGIAAAWLSPIFTSPMADFGYDIANYTEIDSIFGTMKDFEELIAQAKKVGVKILLDFVPNHTSDESEWFQKSAEKDPEYKDFYVWHPGKMVDGQRSPPTNWVSVFRGSAWEWHEGRQEYYLHQFLKKQPDLNYRNPKVREAMKDVLRFWLNKGVSGFRIDAVPFVFEVAPDANGNWPDEPRNSWVNDTDDYAYLQHIYTVDQPETLNTLYEWRAVLDEFQRENGGDQPVILAETYSPIDVVMKYYGNGTAEGAQIPFNFLLIDWLTNDSDAYHYAETLNTWFNNMPEGRTPNWVIGNHDQNRIASRLGTNRIDIMNILILSLPGCSITYNGEELGMTDVWISWNDTVDPSACNTNPSIYEKFSRDPERTPFQWSDGKNAGFSDGPKTWLPIADNYKQINAKVERGVALSHLNIFKQMHELREQPTFRHGLAEVKPVVSNHVLGVKRTLINEFTYVSVMNIFDEFQMVDLTKAFTDLPEEMEYVIVTDRSSARKGQTTKTHEVRLGPYEAIVLRSLTRLTTSVGYYVYYEAPERKI